MRYCWTRFREWLNSNMTALLNIFDSIVGQGGHFLQRQRILVFRLRFELIMMELFVVVSYVFQVNFLFIVICQFVDF